MRYRRSRILAIFSLVLAAAAFPALAQQAADPMQMGVRLDVDKRQVTVGETLHLTIEFRRMGSGNASILRQPTIATPERFDIRGTSSSTQVMMDGQKMVEISSTKITLVANRSGNETLGPAVMVYQVPGQQPQELKSNGVLVTVVDKPKFRPFAKQPAAAPAMPPAQAAPPPAPPQEDIRDLKPLLSGIGWVLRMLFWLILAIVLVWIVARLVSRWLSRRREAVPVKSEASLLREKYRKLSNEGLTAKEYCLAVSELVRECLMFRHGFEAPDLTTTEVLRALKKAKASPETSEKAEKCLGTCDKVLYADGSLTLKDRQALKTLAGDFLPKG